MGVHRKTLVDRLKAAHLPSPRAMIGWCRLLMAARLLDDPGRTVEQVALKLDFPSGAALRNMFKRYTGLRTTEVRENGGVRCLLHAFKRELAAVTAGKRPTA
jgi:AraC-like DNA-binding protein